MGSKKDVREEYAGLKYPKSRFSEWFNEVIMKAELADLRYNTKGFLVHRPWSVLVMKEMYRLYEKELERKGHLPVWFPAVIPEGNFKKEAEHIEGFAPELFWITHTGKSKLTERLALRPTSETAMYNMYSMWIRSWRDMPLKLYQSCQVWRCDTKATRPFIRGREFHWIESHDVFETMKEAETQVREDMNTTEQVMHQEFGIPFVFFERPEWDKFPGAVHTYAADTVMPDGKVLQQPSTHMLGQNFAKSFGIKFKDKKGKEKTAWQTCYGPAIWRMFASVIAQHGDDKGLIFPFNIAPIHVVIVPIGTDSTVLKKCNNIKNQLDESGLSVIIDDTEKTPGWKFNQWEMKGVPVRLELGPKEAKEKTATLVRRDTGKKTTVKESGLTDAVWDAGTGITTSLIKRADEWLSKNMRMAKDMKSLSYELKKGGLVRVGFCSVDRKGEPCADEIKDSLHAVIRGTMIGLDGKREKVSGRCVVCGKKASSVVHVGKEY
jgi:prolyl-tRNA synthetase